MTESTPSPVAILRQTAFVARQDRVDSYTLEQGAWRRVGALTRPRSSTFAAAVQVEEGMLYVSDPDHFGTSRGNVLVYRQQSAPAWHAWQLWDPSPDAIGAQYRAEISTENLRKAWQEGWRYRWVSRFLDDHREAPSLAFTCGHGRTRYTVRLDLNEDGDLVALVGDVSREEHVLTSDPLSVAAYHEHEMVFDAERGEVTCPAERGGRAGVSWGAVSLQGAAVVNVHMVQFQLNSTGRVLATYDAGTENDRAQAPDPSWQGWISLPGQGTGSGARPVSPDISTVWRLERVLDLCGAVSPAGTQLHAGSGVRTQSWRWTTRGQDCLQDLWGARVLEIEHDETDTLSFNQDDRPCRHGMAWMADPTFRATGCGAG